MQLEHAGLHMLEPPKHPAHRALHKGSGYDHQQNLAMSGNLLDVVGGAQRFRQRETLWHARSGHFRCSLVRRSSP